MQYFFVLGNNSTLSIAEIINALNRRGVLYTLDLISEEILILGVAQELEAELLQAQLGGTIKIGRIIGRTSLEQSNLSQIILNQITEKVKLKRVYFGFSVYSLDKSQNLNWWLSKIKKLAMGVKVNLKKQNVSCRWVSSKERNLSSVIVQKNKLLSQGSEFCFLVGQSGSYLGQTLTCQAFEEYEFYDFARPARSMKQGMLPPKLAKIMINLAQAPQNSTILDPFCGSGTILQEAARLSYHNLIGADINPEAIDSTKANLKWLAENYKVPIADYQLFQSDVRNLSQKIAEKSVETIITEPYLGPIQIANSQFSITKIIDELSELYLAAFQEFKRILKLNGKIVIILPIFKVGSALHYLPILEQIKNQGWQAINPLLENLQKSPAIKITPRNSIIYSRPEQQVWREIFVFQLK